MITCNILLLFACLLTIGTTAQQTINTTCSDSCIATSNAVSPCMIASPNYDILDAKDVPPSWTNCLCNQNFVNAYYACINCNGTLAALNETYNQYVGLNNVFFACNGSSSPLIDPRDGIAKTGNKSSVLSSSSPRLSVDSHHFPSILIAFMHFIFWLFLIN